MNFGLLILRLVTGGLFAVHGYPKLFGGPEKQVSPAAARHLGQGFVQAIQAGPGGFRGMLEGINVPAPSFMSRLVGGLEFFGGIMLAMGILTRPVALLLSAEMGVAIWKVHWRNGLIAQGGYEFPLLMLGSSLALLFTGHGKTALGKH